VGGVQTLHDIIIYEEIASECMSMMSYHDVSTAPSIMHISAFLISKDGLLKCVGFESADFHMPPSDIGLSLNILLANL
jgi:hypothetical protein